MIIHSHEYFIALKKEIEGFKEYIGNQQYSNDVVFLKDGIEKELKFIDTALSMRNCSGCQHRAGTVTEEGTLSDGAYCRVNGVFNKGFKPNSYVCCNWIWDDVPM